MEEGSSLASLLAAKVSRLRPSHTLVTRADGSCYVETRDSSGCFTAMPSDNYAGELGRQGDSDVTGPVAHGKKLITHGHNFTELIPGNLSNGPKSLTHSTTRLLSATCPGFVVDTKPDLRSSLILPHLLLAGQDVAYDVDILAEFGVTHILSLVPPEAVVQESCWVLSDEGHLLKHPLISNLPEIGSHEARTSPHREIVTHEEMPTADLELLEVCETSRKHNTEVMKTELEFSEEGNGSSLTSTEVNSTENVFSHNSSKEKISSQSPNKMGGSCTDNLEQLSTCSDTLRRVYCAMLDTPEFVILSSLMRCIKFINIVRDGGGVVLVHCNAGVSRAPTVVIAYCMHQMNLTYDEAFDFVKQKRTFIRPNEGFVRQLRSFEVFLRSA